MQCEQQGHRLRVAEALTHMADRLHIMEDTLGAVPEVVSRWTHALDHPGKRAQDALARWTALCGAHHAQREDEVAQVGHCTLVGREAGVANLALADGEDAGGEPALDGLGQEVETGGGAVPGEEASEEQPALGGSFAELRMTSERR